MRAAWHLRANALVGAWLVAAVVMTIVHRQVAASGWLMVHLLMLGAISTAIYIWSAHFAQALRRRPMPTGQRGQVARLAAHTSGAILVIAGVVAGLTPTIVAGAIVVGAVALWHGGEILAMSRGALGNRLGWTTWAYVAAAALLGVGVVLGVLLAQGQASPEGAARLYLAHVTVMILGWVGLTVMATLVTLWPTVLAVRVPDRGVPLAKTGLIVMGLGLMVALGAVAVDMPAAYAIAIAVIGAGIAAVAIPMVRAAIDRAPGTVAALHLGAAVAFWCGGSLAWAILVARSDSWEHAGERIGPVVSALVAGGAAQVLLGALMHLIPMVLGGGAAAVRAARDAVERGALARFVLINGGILLWVLPSPSLAKVAGSSLALVGAVWLGVAIVIAVRRSFAAREAPAKPDTVRVSPVELAAHRPRLAGDGGALVAAGALLLATAVTVGADPAAVGVGAASNGGVEPTGVVVEVTVEAADMRFTPGDITIDAGDRLVITVVNTDDVAHDLVLDTGQSTGRLAPGASATIDVGVVGRSLEGWCSIAGHRQMGMVLTVAVSGADDQATSDDGEHQHGSEAESSTEPALDGAALVDLQGTMAGGPFDAALAPSKPAGTVHQVTLEVTNEVREVAPGVTQELWTFGGEVPAPTLRGKVGDVFEITLVNNGDMGHSIDFHASWIAPDDAMRTIEPGESLTYRFIAERAGAWLYHCSTAPMSLHIANGMFGAVIIDPPDLEPVDREFVIVQSEMYLGADGGIADADKIAAEAPDLVVFNGHATQYREHPLEARVGEKVRVWVVVAGPSRASSFHVVGSQFDTVYFEGAYHLGGPGAEPSGGGQALALQPGQGGFVELSFPEPGTYPFVSHIMVDAERGAAGAFLVTDG